MGLTKQDHVLGSVREFIIQGEYRPDSRLYVDEVAARLAVSQTPVREALRQLEVEGLVTSLPRHGWVVARPTFDQICQIFLIRRALEGVATELAVPRLTPADLEELVAVQEEAVEAVRHLEYQRVRVCNRKFHQVIYRAAAAPLLTEVLQMVWTRLPYDLVAVVRELPETSYHDHQVLLETLRGGDPRTAAEEMQDHMARMLECYMRWGRAAGVDRPANQSIPRVPPVASATGAQDPYQQL